MDLLSIGEPSIQKNLPSSTLSSQSILPNHVKAHTQESTSNSMHVVDLLDGLSSSPISGT